MLMPAVGLFETDFLFFLVEFFFEDSFIKGSVTAALDLNGEIELFF